MLKEQYKESNFLSLIASELEARFLPLEGLKRGSLKVNVLDKPINFSGLKKVHEGNWSYEDGEIFLHLYLDDTYLYLEAKKLGAFQFALDGSSLSFFKVPSNPNDEFLEILLSLSLFTPFSSKRRILFARKCC